MIKAPYILQESFVMTFVGYKVLLFIPDFFIDFILLHQVLSQDSYRGLEL